VEISFLLKVKVATQGSRRKAFLKTPVRLIKINIQLTVFQIHHETGFRLARSPEFCTHHALSANKSSFPGLLTSKDIF